MDLIDGDDVVTIDSTKPRARAMKLLEEAGLYILTVRNYMDSAIRSLSLIWT